MLDSATPQLDLWSQNDAVDDWTVRESQRARRLTVRVYYTGRVEVVVPRRTSRRTVTEFIDRHRVWIEGKRGQMQRNALHTEPFPPQRIELAACHESWRVHLAGEDGPARIQNIAPGLLGLMGNARGMRQALRGWLMEKAYETLAPMLAAVAHDVGMSYRRVSIRRQRTRWGSCSSRGTISLNCALLFQQPQVVRYLLIHELAHTQQMNHSRRFWDCVGKHCADYERLDAQLKEGWKRVPGWVFER
jgi:predicted metal-dependent hydrolase